MTDHVICIAELGVNDLTIQDNDALTAEHWSVWLFCSWLANHQPVPTTVGKRRDNYAWNVEMGTQVIWAL